MMPTRKIKLPIRRKVIPEGFEEFQFNQVFNKEPVNAFRTWIDIHTGKWCCTVLIEKKKLDRK